MPASERAPIPRVLVWSALFLAPVILLAFEPEGVAHPWQHQLRSLLAVWLYSLCVVASIHGVTELFAAWIDRTERDGRHPVAMLAGVALSLVVVAIFSVPVAPVLARVCPGIEGHETALVVRGVLLGAVYGVVGAGLGHTLRAWLAARVASERAERAVTEARLAALTARTQPHFVANALNTIAEAVRSDPAKAETLIEDLGGLFSHALSGSALGEVALVDELSAARSYLSVQAARFGDRLSFTVDGDALELDTNVPAMSILPLVENAVLHGLSRGGRVRIGLSARHVEEGVVIEVHDDGPGPEGTQHVGHGKGLLDLSQRLDLAYGETRAGLELRREDHRTVARLRLPLVGPSPAEGTA
ncbi:MAG: sensor histidine kinase [Deltaproteobacteria bacterium]